MQHYQNRDLGVSLAVFLFRCAEWLDGKIYIGNPYIYRSAKIYVPRYPLLPHYVGEPRLESEEFNLRQDITTKRWQFSTVSVITGYQEWRDLSEYQTSIILNAFEREQTPVLTISHEA